MSGLVERLRELLPEVDDDRFRDIVQAIRNSSLHQAALLLATYVAGARGNLAEPHCRNIVQMWGQLAQEVDQEVERLGRLALGIPLPE